MTLMRSAALLAMVAAGCGGGGGDAADPDRVPDVRGMATGDATHLLAAHGLRWREGDTPPESTPKGHEARALVTGQRPAPGAPAEPGMVISLGQAPPRVRGEDELPYFSRMFRYVRRTRDPRVVRIGLRPLPSCTDPRAVRTHIAGDVAIVDLRLRTPPPRTRCPLERRPELRVRFGGPVGDRAVLPGPILRPRPSEAGERPDSWERAAVVSPDGRTIGVTWTGGIPECHALAGVVAEEGPDEVRIALRTGEPEGKGPEACILLGVPAVALVRLREPLGPRRLVDAAD
jgi:hypothetical protein